MPPKTVECRKCGWEGTQDSMEQYRCPKCGSRQLRTEGSRMSQEGRNPPPGAEEGEDFSAAD